MKKLPGGMNDEELRELLFQAGGSQSPAQRELPPGYEEEWWRRQAVGIRRRAALGTVVSLLMVAASVWLVAQPTWVWMRVLCGVGVAAWSYASWFFVRTLGRGRWAW